MHQNFFSRFGDAESQIKIRFKTRKNKNFDFANALAPHTHVSHNHRQILILMNSLQKMSHDFLLVKVHIISLLVFNACSTNA